MDYDHWYGLAVAILAVGFALWSLWVSYRAKRMYGRYKPKRR